MSVAPYSSLTSSPYRLSPDPGIALTAEQKRLIRESVLRLEPALDLVGQLFFHKLFRLDPFFRARFAGPAEIQGRKFIAALKLGIVSLNYEGGLAPTLKLLGVRHRLLGIKVRHYRLMTKALIWTLEQSLGNHFTRETKEAWSAMLTEITRVMSGSDAALLRSVS